MKTKYLSALFVLFAAAFALYACGGGSMDRDPATSDMADTPTNGVSQSTDMTDDVVGGTDGSIIPGVPDITTTPGNVTDMPNTDKPGGEGMLENGGNASRDTADTSSADTSTPVTTADDTTAPAVRPPEGK